MVGSAFWALDRHSEQTMEAVGNNNVHIEKNSEQAIVNVSMSELIIPEQGVPVLMYHSVGNEQNNDAVISPEHFTEQMAYLKQAGYYTITLSELYDYVQEKKKLPPKPVVITFDDGYQDTYQTVLPVLKQYGLHGVLFFSVSQAGKTLTWQQLQEMKAAGMEIASHGYVHESLPKMTLQRQRQEITEAKAILDQQLAQDTRFFCYPNGDYSQDTLNILQENGFVLAVTIEPGWTKSGDNPLLLRRVWLGNDVDLVHFAERLSKADYSIL